MQRERFDGREKAGEDPAKASLDISLPEPLREFIEAEVRRGGYATVSEYLSDLVQRAMDEQDLHERLRAALASRDLGAFESSDFGALRRLARGSVPDPT